MERTEERFDLKPDDMSLAISTSLDGPRSPFAVEDVIATSIAPKSKDNDEDEPATVHTKKSPAAVDGALSLSYAPAVRWVTT